MDTPGSTPRSSARCWLPVALLGLALVATVAAMPAPAQAADVQVRVLVDVADLVFRSGRPYYYDEGYYRPVVVEYDRWRRPVYYRYGPPPRPVVVYRPAPHYHPPVPRYRVSYDPRHDRWDRDDRRHYRKHDTHGHRGHRGHRDRDDWDD